MKLHYLEILNQCFYDLENHNKDSSMIKANFKKSYELLKIKLNQIYKKDLSHYMIFNNTKKYIVLDIDEREKYIKLKEIKMRA